VGTLPRLVTGTVLECSSSSSSRMKMKMEMTSCSGSDSDSDSAEVLLLFSFSRLLLLFVNDDECPPLPARNAAVLLPCSINSFDACFLLALPAQGCCR